MEIELKPDPENKSPYQRGDRIILFGNPENECIVIGENDEYLHTIILKSGICYGINKIANSGQNLECVTLLEACKI